MYGILFILILAIIYFSWYMLNAYKHIEKFQDFEILALSMMIWSTSIIGIIYIFLFRL